MKLFLLILVFPYILAFDPNETFDFVEDALAKYVNHSVDPCDNFYRHACSFNSPYNLITVAFENLVEYLEKQQENAFYNHLQFIPEFRNIASRIRSSNSEETIGEFYSRIISDVCGDQKIKEKNTKDPELCKFAIESLSESKRYMKENIVAMSDYFKDRLDNIIGSMKAIHAILDVDVRRGVEQTRKMFLRVLSIAENMIKDTPWAENAHVVSRIEQITKRLELHDNYAQDLEIFTESLFHTEKSYLDCKKRFGFLENGDFFCYFVQQFGEKLLIVTETFSTKDNAANVHPNVYVGYPNYYHTQYGYEMAAKLGYTGFTVAHEIGHTFIESKTDKLLPYFSEKAKNCIQNQHIRTCREFKEISCDIDDNFFDDNGADIFGLQLAYQLLEEFFGDRIDDNIEKLKVTNKQLFFYSFAFQFCRGPLSSVTPKEYRSEGEHSADNVRVNVAAQHPAFKEAFDCAPDSRMMRTVTEQCLIYGEGAPETRRIRQ